MGVHGLWKLLEPAGKPVPLETLENKVLAVDVSIWLYQLTKGFQTTGGGIVPNAHILGLFNRICKLLYYRIKPVFIFDGGVPSLKRETIEARKRQKLKAKDVSERLRERLLDNLLKQKAVRNLLGNDDLPSNQQKNENDIFALPPLPNQNEEDEITDSEDENDNSEMNSAKIESFCNHQYGKDVHSIDINSEQFKSLPPEIRHDILSELQETRKQSSWAKIHEMPDESSDFSKFQMERLVKRRNVQRSLDSAAKEIGGRMMTMGELEEVFREQGIVTDSLPGRRIAGDNVTRYVYLTGDKTDANKSTDEQTQFHVEKEKPDANFPICPTETEAEGRTTIKTEIDESEFRKNIYAIDQCVFVNSSSSDEEVENYQDVGRDYAKQLSMEEKMSQEEIFNLIKHQNSKFNNDGANTKSSINYPDAIPSTSSAYTRTYTDHSDIEDDPDPIAVPSSSKWTPSSSSQHSPRVLSPELSAPTSNVNTKSNEGFTKSMTKLDQLISTVKGREISEPSLSKKFEEKSFKLSSDSDSEDGFVEVIEEGAKSQYFGGRPTIEISIDPTKIEDDLFADVFESTQSVELNETNDAIKEIAIVSKETSEQVEVSPRIVQDKCSVETLIISDEKQASTAFEMSKSSEPNVISNSDKLSAREESKPEEDIRSKSPVVEMKTSETIQSSRIQIGVKAQTKSKIDEITKERVRKISEIFHRVRKINDNRKKTEEKTETEESSATVIDENLAEVQRVLDSEHSELMSEQGKQERFGATITQQMIIEAQELLRLFGLPFLVAPMEAEAQCAFLDQISLTEGTITDDSDIWLFGGQKVYKNFFDNRKYVLQFRNVDIEHFFKLSREQLIQLALLVGSDYTVGIEGVGPVTAIEILAYFSEKSKKLETEADIAETLRKFKLWIHNNRRGTSVLAKKVKNVRLSDGFPDVSVIEAYMYPTVNESKEGFSWGPPDLDSIRQYMKTKFGWKTTRIDEILVPVMKRLAERNKQTTLDAFFKARPFYSMDSAGMSKRVIEAINIMKNKVDVDVSQLPTKNPRKSPNKGSNLSPKPKRTRKSNSSSQPVSSRGNRKSAIVQAVLSSPQKPSNVLLQEIIPQREKDRLEAAKRKMAAIKVFRAKRNNRSAKRKQGVLKPKADSSYLSESSSGSGDD